MLRHTKALEDPEDDLVLKLTSKTCSTRITTSQYKDFRKLLESLPCSLRHFENFIAPNVYGPLINFQLTTDTCQEGKPYCLGNVYSLSFEGVEKPILAELKEYEVYHSIYCDEKVSDAIGIEGCVAIDIALAKGGTEAIAESFYSVMKSQQCTGGQSNEILALR